LKFNLANGDLAMRHLFFVGVNDTAGNICKVRLLWVIAPTDSQFAEADSAQQSQAGGLQIDLRAHHVAGEFVDDLLPNRFRISPAMIAKRDYGQSAEEK